MSDVATAIAILAAANVALGIGVLVMVRQLRRMPPEQPRPARRARRRRAAIGEVTSA